MPNKGGQVLKYSKGFQVCLIERPAFFSLNPSLLSTCAVFDD